MPATPRRRNLAPTDAAGRLLEDITANNIRAYRRLRSMSQDALAANMRKIGHPTWSRSTVGEVERSGRSLSSTERLALAAILDVAPPDLEDPTGIDGRGSGTVNIGNLELPATIARAWLRGALRLSFQGPTRLSIEAVPGHDAEYEDAKTALHDVRFNPLQPLPTTT